MGESQPIRFGAFELDAGAGELRKQGLKIRLQEQPLRILQMLLANPGQVVTRDELRNALWPTNSYVDFDHGLHRAINKLREALGDSADSPRFIETLARRGYRFLGEATADAGQIRSLLILPLENLSPDPEEGYFAEALTEALISTLAKIGALRVLSRTTSAYYKRAQKTLPEMVRELGIDGVIEGSVLRSGSRVRITVQLLHARTDRHLWAESYDRDSGDIFALQAEVTEAIVKEIRVKITANEQSQLARTPAVNPAAYEAYLRGVCYWDKRSPEALRTARQSFEQAIAADPGYAAAYAGIAQCFNVPGWNGFVAPVEGCEKARTWALRALELDPSLGQAHAALAWVAAYFDYDFATAEREYQCCIRLDPRYSTAYGHYGIALACVERNEEAIAKCKEGISSDPHSVMTHALLDFVYWLTGRFDDLLKHAKRTAELHPDAPHAHWALGIASVEARNFDEAIAEYQHAVRCAQDAKLFVGLLAEAYALAARRSEALTLLAQLQSAEQYVNPFMIARIHLALGERDAALCDLEVAYAERAAWMIMLRCDPHLASLRSEPRFISLLRRMKLPS